MFTLLEICKRYKHWTKELYGRSDCTVVVLPPPPFLHIAALLALAIIVMAITSKKHGTCTALNEKPNQSNRQLVLLNEMQLLLLFVIICCICVAQVWNCHNKTPYYLYCSMLALIFFFIHELFNKTIKSLNRTADSRAIQLVCMLILLAVRQ